MGMKSLNNLTDLFAFFGYPQIFVLLPMLLCTLSKQLAFFWEESVQLSYTVSQTFRHLASSKWFLLPFKYRIDEF